MTYTAPERAVSWTLLLCCIVAPPAAISFLVPTYRAYLLLLILCLGYYATNIYIIIKCAFSDRSVRGRRRGIDLSLAKRFWTPFFCRLLVRPSPRPSGLFARFLLADVFAVYSLGFFLITALCISQSLNQRVLFPEYYNQCSLIGFSFFKFRSYGVMRI